MIEVWAGNTADQLQAAHCLWNAWSLEEHDRELDTPSWVQETQNGILAQRLMYLIAYDAISGKPVGMVQAGWQYDVMEQAWLGFGDHAYVCPDYRDTGTFTALYDAIMGFAEAMDFDNVAMPVGTTGVGEFLEPFYKKHGFVDKAHILRQPSPWRLN